RDISFRQLQARIYQVANAFTALGVDEDSTVGLLLPGLPETFIAMLAAEITGRACPINFTLQASVIAEILHATDAKVLVAFGPDADLDIWQKVKEIRRLLPDIKVVCVGADPEDASVTRFDQLGRDMPETLTSKRIIAPDDLA